MPPKKSTIRKTGPNEKAVQLAEKFISELNLKTLCPRKIFDIIFLAPDDEDSHDSLRELAHISEEYENVACTTFINYEEVIHLSQEFVDTDLPPPFPTHIKVLLLKAQETLEEFGVLPSNLMAQLTKLKLVNVMYQNYLREQEIQQRKIKLENDLRLLTKECIKKAKSSPKDLKKEQSSRKSDTKSVGEANIFGCTPSNEDEQLVFDDDIKNHVWLYIFYGCSNIEVFKLLISSFHIPISAVIKISLLPTNGWLVMKSSKSEATIESVGTASAIIIKIRNVQDTTESMLTNISKSRVLLDSPPKSVSAASVDKEVVSNGSKEGLREVFTTIESNTSVTDIYSSFLEALFDAFDGPHRLKSLENTIRMNFESGGDNYKRLLEELLYVAKHILYLKLQHIHYIRHITLHKVQREYNNLPPYCLDIYYKLIDSIPSQLVSEIIVLTSLVEEVDIRLENSLKKKSSLVKMLGDISESSFKVDRKCQNPCDLEQALHNDEEMDQAFTKGITKKNYLIHEANLDTSFGKKVFAVIKDIVKDMNKNINSLGILKNYFEPYEIFHRHDKDPSTVTNDSLSENFLHLMYIFLFSLFKHRKKMFKNSTEFKEDLLENVELHNSYEFFTLSQIEVEHILVYGSNFYDTSIGAYRWREKLSSDALIKEIAQAENSYLYVDKSYCSETDSYLLLFSDYVDEFGINTEVFEETLSTPVCLRDFCKFLLIEKWEWLQSNQPPKYKRKVEKLEECPGFKKIVALNLFPEYRHLLENKATVETDENKEETEEEPDIEFSDILAELEKYPRNDKLWKEFNKLTPEVLAFDLGTQYVCVRGARTTFLSHDDVKITVDNTRFTDDEPQCSVNLNSRNNQFIFYCHQYFLSNVFNFHANLSDGTIITFILQEEETPEPKKKKCQSVVSEQSREETVDDTTEIKQVVTEEHVTTANSNDILEQIKVICVDRKEFERNTEAEIPSLDSSFDIDELLLSLQNIEKDTSKVYKIISNLKYLNLNSDIEIPLTNLLRRLVPVEHAEIEEPTFVKRFMSIQKPPTIKKPPSIDFRITMPNNLFVSTYMSEITHTPMIEIKQEFLKSETSLTKTEEFRLFSRKGFVLIKRTDGTIIIKESNGDQVHFEKPSTDDENIRRSNLKECHCMDVDDYRKRVNKVLENKDELYFASRRAQRHSKKGYVINKSILEALKAFKVPYRKITVLKFDGHKTCIEGNKVVQKQVYFTTCEHDFYSEEMYFERSDGLQSLYNKFGKYTVVFPDGTKIINTAYTDPDLIDGFVFISVEIIYQHPDYVDVRYTLNYSVSLKYNNFIITRDQEDQITLKIDSDIETKFEREQMFFNKTCKDCQQDFRCHFNLKPFAHKYIDLNEQFLHADDSYNKHFYANFRGHCKRSSGYINEALNRADCNHVDNKVYKKLFVVKDNYTGNQFWTGNMVECRRRLTANDPDSSVTEIVLDEEKLLVKFNKNIFYPYQEQLLLAKYVTKPDLDLAFTTFRIVQEMVTFEEVNNFFAKLIDFLIEKNFEFLDLLTKIRRIASSILKFGAGEFREKEETIEEPEVCECAVVRITMKEKTEKWKRELEHFWKLIRNKVIPGYFQSEFCKISKK